MAQSRPKHPGGRPRGSRNKATIERERKALADLQKRAAEAVISPFAKDELAALIPEGKELLGIVKGIMERFRQKAFAKGAKGATWQDLKDWLGLYAEVMLKLSQIEYRAADFQSPKIRAIVVAPTPEKRPGERLTRFSLKVFEGGRAMLPPPSANSPIIKAQVNGPEPPKPTGTDEQEV